MPGRGNGRGRARGGNFKLSNRGEREHSSVLDRLGKPNSFSKNNADPRSLPKKSSFKYVRHPESTSSSLSSIAPLPAEPRVRALSRKFLSEYFKIFDKPGRDDLESMYSPDAFFSFSSTFPMPTIGRNLIHVRDPQTRLSLLVHGKTEIARNLMAFSPTEHNIQNLSYDVPFYVASPMSISSLELAVTGVFKDTSQTTDPLRAFMRVFILKQVGDREGDPIYHIYNDLFMLLPPTPGQIKKYHLDMQVTKNKQSGQSGTQQELVQSIMAKTKMNSAASRRLLEENGWNEQAALDTFNTLLSLNKVPQDCFAV